MLAANFTGPVLSLDDLIASLRALHLQRQLLQHVQLQVLKLQLQNTYLQQFAAATCRRSSNMLAQTHLLPGHPCAPASLPLAAVGFQAPGASEAAKDLCPSSNLPEHPSCAAIRNCRCLNSFAFGMNGPATPFKGITIGFSWLRINTKQNSARCTALKRSACATVSLDLAWRRKDPIRGSISMADVVS